MRKWIVIGLIAAHLLGITAIPPIVRRFTEQRREICLLHLLQIDTAIGQNGVCPVFRV